MRGALMWTCRLAGVLAFLGWLPQSAPPATEQPRDMVAARRALAHKPRRVLFNNDGNDPITQISRPDVGDMLAARTSALADTQVDAIAYCTFSAGFGNFSHLTKVGQVHVATEGQFARNQMATFVAAGVDPLAEMVKFAHAHRMELFWSMRMNDTHDGGRSGQGPILFGNNKLKVAHPEWLLGRPFEKLATGSWSGMDYAHPEVRELARRYVEEVCANYDVDGVELDFTRHAVFFQATTRRETCSDDDRAAMTEMMGRIRGTLDAAGRKRGRPILLIARLPSSAEYCHSVGLDLRGWLGAGLIDVLVPAGYFQLRPYGELVALGHERDVPVYASLDDCRSRDAESQRMRQSDAAYRARAANALTAGSDAIYLFNFFDSHSRLWRELGSLETLAGKDKDYFASYQGIGPAAGGNLPLRNFQTIETLTPDNPRVLSTGKPATAHIEVAEDLSHGTLPDLTLRLRFDRSTAAGELVVSLNGHALAAAASDKSGWVEWKVSADQLVCVLNEVQVIASGERPLKWLDAVLQARYPH